MRKLLEYLLPTNDIAYGIVVFIVILFVVWLGWLIRWFLWLKRQRTHMKRCADVRTLKEGLQARLTKGEMAGTSTGEDVLQLSPAGGAGAGEADAVFRQFCKTHSIKEKSIVANHVRTIFNAGWEESRLETGELIKHTTNELFRANGVLRSLLGTFIIVGILGTLFGLADSLANLSPHGMNQQNNMAQLQEGLNRLLFALKSAFAPSIWGVGFTILGVLIFNMYIQWAAAPARNMLESLSLSIWVPQLYPSVSQKMVETLQRSQQEMERSFEAAKKVAVFAESIQGKVSKLDQSLRSADGALSTLAETSAGINTFADKFVEGVKTLAPFQDELRTLYLRMVEDSKTFQANVSNSSDRAREIQQQAHAILEGQYRQLQAVIAGLKSYEDAYVTERKEIDKKIQEVLDAARSAFLDLGERNRELVMAVGDPLRTELVTKLGDVENTLRVQLKGIQDRFAKFDAPINKAADQIEGSLTSVVKRTETLTKELKSEFLQQNRTHHEQLEQLNKVNQQIPNLLERLSTASKDHDEGNLLLKDAMTSLVNGVDKLDHSIGTLSQTINLPEQDGQQISTVQAGSILLQLFKDNETQKGQLKLLLEEIYQLRRNVGEPGRYRPSGDVERPGRFPTGAGPTSGSVVGIPPPRPSTTVPFKEAESQKARSQPTAQGSASQTSSIQPSPTQAPPSQTSPGQAQVAPKPPPPQAPVPPSPVTPQRAVPRQDPRVPMFGEYTDQDKWDSGPSVSKVIGKLRFWRK